MDTRRIKIITSVDRPHMTYDILTVFHEHDISITWMEVYTFVVYIKFPKDIPITWESMKEELLEVDGVQAIEEIDLIAVEEREVEMKTVLDIVSQGVIVLNREGKIRYINKYTAENILMISAKQSTNQCITKYIKDDKVKEFLNIIDSTKSMENTEIEIKGQTYLLSINTLLSAENIFCGYMITLQDVKRIGDFLNDKRYDNPITFDDIIGKSSKMMEVINRAKLFALSNSSVLITGESGTGKELFARAIHNLSQRCNKPFVAINCAAIPDQLLESELFGYEGGSFTGGKKNGKIGLLEVANGGTIFLDEIGEMAPHLQAKFLRVLQEGTIRKVGGDREIPINVRVLSATNQNIEVMVKNKKFRLDLLYRINIFSVQIPPLKDRKEDLPILIEYFINMHKRRYNKDIYSVEVKAMEKLIAYSWPGNVRELQNVMERAVALTKENQIRAKDIFLSYSLEENEQREFISLKDRVEDLEKSIIIEALKNHNSIRESARSLEVTHTLLINRMKKYNIKSSNWRSENEKRIYD